MKSSGLSFRILLVCKGLSMGGAERLLLQTIRYMQQADCTFFLLNIDPKHEELKEDIEKLNVRIMPLPFYSAFSPLRLHRAVHYVKANKINLIHAHLPMAGVFARIIGKLTSIPVVYTEHSIVGNYRPITRMANRLTYHLNAITIAVSDAVRESIGETYGQSQLRNCRLIANGIDVPAIEAEAEGLDVRSELGISPTSRIIGTVASFRPVKRIDLLIRAFARLISGGQDIVLLLVGYGDILPKLRDLASNLRVTNRIIFTGIRPDAPRFLKAMDIFVLCSEWEGLPLALLEAMALSLPVIATDVGGVTEVVKEGVTGRLVPSGDEQALAQTMEELILDYTQRLRLGKAARNEVVFRGGVDRNCDSILKVYKEATQL